MKVDIGVWRKNRKVKIEVKEYDIWSLYQTASLILLPLFIKFRETERHGIPGFLLVDKNAPHSEMDMKLAEEKWNEIQDKIIFSLQELVNCEENAPESPGYFEFDPEFKLVGTTDEEYEAWSERYNQYSAKIQEGLELMGKHFLNFWD